MFTIKIVTTKNYRLNYQQPYNNQLFQLLNKICCVFILFRNEKKINLHSDFAIFRYTPLKSLVLAPLRLRFSPCLSKNCFIIDSKFIFSSFLILGLCFTSFNGLAQDEQIQIDATWKLNDTLLYEIKDYVVEAVGEGEADTLASAIKMLQMVVVDSSKYGYLLQWETLDLKTTGDAYGPLIKKEIKMEYRTDAYGLVEELINWETIRTLVYKEIEQIVENQLTESDLIFWGQNAVESAYALSTQEGIGSLFAKDLQLLHFNYGTQYINGETLEFDKNFPVTFGSGKVPGKGQILCELSDSTVTVKSNSSTDEAALKNYYLEVLKELNGKVPAKEKRKIKQQPLYIKSERNYTYNVNSLTLLKANYTRTQLIEDISTSNVVEIMLLNTSTN